MLLKKDTPQPTRALQEFVKHIADPLVNKGWNLHLKFGKGESQGEKFVKALLHGNPQQKLTEKKKLVNPKQAGRFHLKGALVEVEVEVRKEEVEAKSLLKIRLI